MAWPSSLQIALKEWQSICHSLESGQQILLLRKGGIYESAGEFEVEHNEFLLFPTYVHQKMEMIKEEARGTLEARSEEPSEIKLSAAGVVSDVIAVKSRAQLDAIDAEHIWTSPLLDMRFNYKPQSPLFLLLLRVYRLHEPVAIDNTPAYAGCKSWVPLEQPVPTGDAMPVLDDLKYEFSRGRILQKLTPP